MGRRAWGLLASSACMATAGEVGGGKNEQYASGYASPDIHRDMLQDSLRTKAYQEALTMHGAVRGKAVMDFGCGTGILSLFAASAGARHVYCVEASKLARTTEQIVDKNNYSSVITVVNQWGEDLELPEQVDVIVSEWMGYLLILEDMLVPLLRVRDKWLKPGGLMLPRYASIWVQAYSDDKWWSENLGFWRTSPHGLDMSPLDMSAHDTAWPYPVRSQWRPAGLLAQPHRFVEWDLQTFELDGEAEQHWDSQVELRTGGAAAHGLLLWFDVNFPHAGGNVTLSTHPEVGVQHWGQVLWPLRGAPLAAPDLAIEGILRLWHKSPAWRLSLAWSARPLVVDLVSAATGDLYADQFGSPDEWGYVQALKALTGEWARASGEQRWSGLARAEL